MEEAMNGEVLSPSEREKIEAQRRLIHERVEAQLRTERKWSAVMHCIIIFAVVSLAALGVIYCASIFGVYETVAGAAFAMAASATAFVYIQNA